MNYNLKEFKINLVQPSLKINELAAMIIIFNETNNEIQNMELTVKIDPNSTYILNNNTSENKEKKYINFDWIFIEHNKSESQAEFLINTADNRGKIKKNSFSKSWDFQSNEFMNTWKNFCDIFSLRDNTSALLKLGNEEESFAKLDQTLNFEELKTLVNNSGLFPKEGQVDYNYMHYCLKKIFLRYQTNGFINIKYKLILN